MAQDTHEVRLPHRYKARRYQARLLDAMARGKRRACTVWHRRSGKDTTWLNYTIWQMYQRPGTYYHLFPQRTRGRKILWEGKNRDGMPFLDHFPKDIIKRRREDEMLIELHPRPGHSAGSIWQIAGTDQNLDAIVGTNPIGVVFSEFSQMKSRAWDLIRPILLENGGFAAFNFTPRGHNHAWDVYQVAARNPDWYCSVETVATTRRDGPGESGAPVLTAAQIEQERRDGMREPMVQQEYFCSFEAGSALQFIPYAYIQAALMRPELPSLWAPIIIGVDVGRNRDRCVFTVRQGSLILERVILYPYDMAQNAQTIAGGRLAQLINAFPTATVFVDGVGIGGPLVDYMHTLGYHCLPILGQSPPSDPRYYNKRAEMWASMREWSRSTGHLEQARDVELIAEMQAPQSRYKGDKEWLTPKDELEADDEGLEEYASPDVADSLALTFAEPVSPQALGALRGRATSSAPVLYDPFNPEAALAQAQARQRW